MSDLKDRIVKHEIIERITIIGPSEESREAYQWLGRGDYRIVTSGPYRDREMWPKVDVSRYKITAERAIERPEQRTAEKVYDSAEGG